MRKRRTISVRPQSRPKSDINVTPLVDVVLVLLILFMVMTPLADKMLRVRVPDAEETDDVRIAGRQILVSVSARGAIAIDSDEVADADYLGRLQRVLAARAPGDRIVFVTADDAAAYPRLVAALDGARRAGAETLTFTTEPSGAGDEPRLTRPGSPGSTR